MVSVPTTNNDNNSRRKIREMIDVYGLDGGDGFTGVYSSPNLQNCVC